MHLEARLPLHPQPLHPMINSKLRPKFFWLLSLTTVLGGMTVSLAQTSGRGEMHRRSNNLSRAADEARQALRNATTSAEQEQQLQSRDSANDGGRMQRLMSEVKDATGDKVEATENTAQNAQLNSALESVSTDEGKVLLAQNSSAPAMRSPGADQVVPAAQVAPADAKPLPIRPTPLDRPAKQEPERTVITSEGAAFFDSKQAMGVFTDDVIVNHPQFHITCDVLEVYMLKDGETPEAKPRPANVLPGETEHTPDSSVKQAIAKGRKVVIQKLSETGEVQIGICRHATYVGATGDIIMRDYPQVQRGRNVVIATDPSTVMTIKPTGELRTQGPNRVDIIQGEDNKKGSTGSGVAPAAGASVKPETNSKLQGAS